MEQDTAAYIAAQKKEREQKTKKRRLLGWIGLGVVTLALAVGGWLLYRSLNARKLQDTLTTYQVTKVDGGEITSVISGSGTLTANHAASFTAPGDYTKVESVNFETGDGIKAGDVVMTLSCLAVEEEIDALETELEEVLDELATVDQEKSSLSVTAPKAGIVKDLRAEAGSVVDDMDYLCLLSTDGKMKTVIEKTDDFSVFDEVLVEIGGLAAEGLVTQVDQDNNATVVLTDDYYPYGETVTVKSQSGAVLGEGTLDVNEYVKVTASAGRVATVACEVNKKYSKGKALFKLAAGAQSEDYLSYKKQREDLEEQIQNLKDGLIITAEWDCILTALSVEKGDKLDEGAALCTLSGSDGYQLALSIDELDIGSIKHGQAATVTLDAVEGEFTGTVENISYVGSGNYITSYSVTIVTEPVTGAYPGMSASAEVVIESSGDSLVVPVGAVQYEGRGKDQTAYLYLAADGAAEGDSQTAQDIDLESLTKATVVTGMSDGSYIVVTGEGIAQGTLIWQSTLTTNATYTSDDTTTTTGFGMGAQMGGMPGGMPGGNYGGGNYGGGNYGGSRGGNRG